MKKIILLVAVFALVVAACSTSDEVAATVNGTEITVGDVDSLVYEEEIPKTEFAQFLGAMITWEAVEQAATEQFGIEVTDEQVDETADELIAQAGPDVPLDEFLESVNTTEKGIEQVARSIAVQESVAEEFTAEVEPVSDEEVAEEVEAFPADWTQVCASHILVETEDEALDIKAQLDDGANFAELAAEFSQDPGSAVNGGDLGCQRSSGYVEPFLDAILIAPIGEVTDPVQTEFGYHVILVVERTTVPEADVRVYLEQNKAQAAISVWFDEVIAVADVTVDEEIGVWVLEPTPQVLASN